MLNAILLGQEFHSLQDSPLLQTVHPERFRFAPHTAWASSEARARLVAMVAENIKTTLINT